MMIRYVKIAILVELWTFVTTIVNGGEILYKDKSTLIIERKKKMALAKKCDRCGKFYDEYNFAKDDKNINGIMTLNLDEHDDYYAHDPLDLCPSCKDSFEKWLNKKGERRL